MIISGEGECDFSFAPEGLEKDRTAKVQERATSQRASRWFSINEQASTASAVGGDFTFNTRVRIQPRPPPPSGSPRAGEPSMMASL